MSTPAIPSQSNCSSISKVRVILRVRPFLPHEIAARNGNSTPCVSVLDSEFDSNPEVTVQLKDQETCRNECYKLDSFFGQEDNNVSKIFYREVSSLIPGIFHGCNATVFAYGATCSGKTYTMQVLRSYGSQSTGNSSVGRQRWADSSQGTVSGSSLSPCLNSMRHFLAENQRRKVAHTGLNDVSSRSHGVLAITVSTHCGDGSGAIVTGKLNLIDLAGNEDNRRTCNEGIRLQESAKINQSLFALSNVIYALNNNQPRVPYRESKLTRILQDSLGGTSHALMVACLNPGEYQESLHTVSLAARFTPYLQFYSSAQKNETPKVKIDMEAKLRAWLESKGKTKSAQRMGAFGSPFLSNALSSAKKPIAYHSSRKTEDMYAPRVDKSEVISDDGGLRNLQQLNLMARFNCICPICASGKSQKHGTPLDKFNVLSSNLKSSLIQEYVDFLNQASREELMELKGIGQKMADYILELRETSPLKSLGDLEKIGLSSKQVHNMFNRTARGILCSPDLLVIVKLIAI
ncbi:ATP binding microtubule motor family protein [Actinidia rufa]|uniref:Kinesin-like protein n=1 Tax=Actinidia rufa TaxID=165716 RepID=A0A7J0E3E1_9ERIC|nr:ATP binding microtubule motor family protein [Actinidia rufa]